MVRGGEHLNVSVANEPAPHVHRPRSQTRSARRSAGRTSVGSESRGWRRGTRVNRHCTGAPVLTRKRTTSERTVRAGAGFNRAIAFALTAAVESL